MKINYFFITFYSNLLICQCFYIKNLVKRAAVPSEDRLWVNGIIPFKINPNIGVQMTATIKQAMAEWEKYTCIEFIDCGNNCFQYESFAFFSLANGICNSNWGRYEGLKIHRISLDIRCNSISILLHEIGHLIGLHHEHVRPDRDKFIKVSLKNIKPEMVDQFEKLDQNQINTSVLQPYDYKSIMHYQRKSFSKNGKDTIKFKKIKKDKKDKKDKEKLDKNVIGTFEYLSESNINEVLELYKCN